MKHGVCGVNEDLPGMRLFPCPKSWLHTAGLSSVSGCDGSVSDYFGGEGARVIMALCMFLAAAGAYLTVVTQLVQFGLLTGLGALGLMIWLMATPHNQETEEKRLAILAGFAFLTGVNLGPLLEMCIAINPSIIPTAFLATAVLFSCFSLSALFAKRRAYLYQGGVLFSGLLLLLLFSLINIFLDSTWLFMANLYIGLMVTCDFVLFDTQLIIEKAENGVKDYIWHCVDLLLDFVNIFRELMVILGMNENKKKEE